MVAAVKHWLLHLSAGLLFAHQAPTAAAAASGGAGAGAAARRSTWHLVDVPMVVCPDSTTKKVDTVIPMEEILDPTKPHVLTFYRTSDRKVSVTYSVHDAQGAEVIGSTTTSLQEVPSRSGRSLAQEDDSGEPDVAATPREITAKVKGGTHDDSGSSHDGGEAAIADAAKERKRRKKKRDTTGSTPPPTMARGDAHTWTGRGGHSYGYSPAHLKREFPRGYVRSTYGYTVRGAYRSDSLAEVPLALGALAVVGASLGSHSAFSRWNTGQWGHQCSVVGEGWTGNCTECVQKYSKQLCILTARPHEDANRDDIMATGFVPKSYSMPLKVSVTGVVGDDYSAARLCPPQGSKATVSWSPPRNQDLFVTLSTVDDLLSDAEQAQARKGMIGGGIVLAAGAVIFMCLGCLVILGYCCLRQQAIKDAQAGETLETPELCCCRPLVKEEGAPQGNETDSERCTCCNRRTEGPRPALHTKSREIMAISPGNSRRR